MTNFHSKTLDRTFDVVYFAEVVQVGGDGGSGAVSGVIRRDTKLRSSIGYQLGVRLDERPSNEDLLPLLDAAIDNQSMLARLDPSDARTRVWLGSLYMRRGEAAGAPIDFVRAARQFQLALAIDPDVPAAAKALQER